MTRNDSCWAWYGSKSATTGITSCAVRRNDDEIVDLVIQAGQQYQAAEAQAKQIDEANSRIWLFWTIWIIASLIIGGITGANVGWLWFCSPGWWFLFGNGTPVVPYRRYWMGWIVSALLLIGCYQTISTVSDGKAVLIVVASSLSVLGLYWLTEKIAERP